MTVRGQQRMFDHVAQELGARQLAGIQVAPLREQAARLVLVAALEGIADVGEVVAELAEAQRQVEHRHVEGERQQQAEVADRAVGQRHQQRRPT